MDELENLPTRPLLDGGDESVNVERVSLQHSLLVDRGFVLRGVLTESECRHYCNSGDTIGFTDVVTAGYRPDYRNNDRIIFQSEQLSSLIFDRISKFLPQAVVVNPETEQNLTCGLGTSGLWKPAYLNSIFRLCKYNPGGHFAPHCDGNYVASPEERSLYTCMIYLNGRESFQGGATHFLTDKQFRNKDETLGIYRADPSTIIEEVVPEVGLTLLFLHNTWHQGDRVEAGCKYILRSDVIYRREPGTALDPVNQKAYRLYQMACEQELSSPLAAMELFRSAFKLSPELEQMYNQRTKEA